ncbi:DUF6088 family protein [Portibacter lacus]|uniref:Type IV toxin-antitoxin system AbiEi family antitoxin domain-containing protein n=1 Tax=Portibacter lacus TaxID=1099794 RepID=A0AA37WE41_9BACT|nr:DUF6088 family protein [Portibacter lacus]GLR15795.1 hypothetical protein GCM10007940_04100 [Portibacter lacus]
MTLSVENQILKSIYNHKRGKIFFPDNFNKYGSSTAVRQALNRLEDKGVLLRLARGIYLFPKKHKVLGILLPTIEDIAKAIAKRDKARIIPTGLYALNKLGFSTQVPVNVVYLTDGSPRKITIGSGSIKFKSAPTKLLAAKNDRMILIIQALKHMKKDNITLEVKKKINKILAEIPNEDIKHDIKLAPSWIRDLITKR